MEAPKTLSREEKNFCELLVCGCPPYIGDERKCYDDVFNDYSNTSRKKAKELMARPDVAQYIADLRKMVSYESADIKARLTEKLLGIIEETSSAVYKDRRGTHLSPAPLRSVAVQASKALMDMYPIKVAQKSEVEINGGAEGGGIVFNVIVPDKPKQE